MDNSWVHLVNNGWYNQLNTGTALANSTSATDISAGGNTSGQAFQFGGGYLQIGQQYRVRAKGLISNTSTPTLTLGIYLGGVAGTALATTGAVTTASGLSNSIWTLEADLRVESTGTSGSIRTLGSVIGLASTVSTLPAGGTSPLVSSLNTSNTNLLTIGATWGTASASNSVQALLFMVERLEDGSS